MGSHRNRKAINVIGYATVILLVGLTMVMVILNVLPGAGP
jgi:Mn2+/Fe2+ NRAMP family transporter